MKIRYYKIIEQIVEQGTDAGYLRARKHTDTPNEETIKNCIMQYIMNGFDETFEFDQEE